MQDRKENKVLFEISTRKVSKGAVMPLSGNKNTILILLVALLLSLPLMAQEYLVQQGARSAGMAGAYSGLGDDANSISANSAGLVRLGRTQLIGSYTRYYTGADIPGMNEGSLFFSPYTWGRMFYGLGVSYFSHEIYSQQKTTIAVGSELWRKKKKTGNSMPVSLSLALNANLYRVAYNQNNFSEDFDPNDPLFANGYNTIAYSGDANLLAEIGKASVALGGYNLLEPDISIRGGVESGTYPRTIRGGVSYNVRNYVIPAIEIEIPLTSNKTISDELTYSVGAESWFVNDMIGARTGLSSDFLTMGLSFRTRGKWDIGVDYALQFPLETPLEIGQTHKVSFEVGMAKPFKVITDFIVEDGSVQTSAELVSSGDEATIYAKVSNIGEMDAKDVPVTVYYVMDGEAYLIGQREIEKMPSGSSEEIEFSFVPPENGYYDIFVAANDKGDKIPALQHKIMETDYDNNTGTKRLAVFNPPETGTVRTSRDELLISTVSKIREEIPMIPAIHFGENSSTVDIERFDNVLNVIATRLSGNPGATIELYGYYDKSTESATEDALAINRSNAVKKELVSRGADADQISVVREGYDSSSEQIKDVLPKDVELIQEENRVVEMEVKLEVPTQLGTYYYEPDEYRPSREARENLESKIKEVIPLFMENSDLYVIFEGFTAADEKENRGTAYLRAVNFRDMALDWVPDWMMRRMLVLCSEGDEEKPRVETYITGDAIIFRPHGTSLSGESLEFGDLGMTDITIDTIISETQIDSHAVAIREEGSDQPFAVVHAGEGRPPRTVAWNWFGDRGQAPDPEKTYFAEVFVRDEFGQTVSNMSNPIDIKVDEQEERKELFLINFNFGKSLATSEYLEARVENLAQNLLDRVKYLGPNARIEATVIGHTDIVGSDKRNRELSWERAEKEYHTLLHGLMTILDLETEEQVLKWLGDHRVKLSYEGRSYREPMVISRFREGYWHKELIGNNEFPEGRLVNRRVVLEIMTITD